MPLTLASAEIVSYEPTVLRLRFDRAIDVTGIVAAQITVEDPSATGFAYVGTSVADTPDARNGLWRPFSRFVASAGFLCGIACSVDKRESPFRGLIRPKRCRNCTAAQALIRKTTYESEVARLSACVRVAYGVHHQ